MSSINIIPRMMMSRLEARLFKGKAVIVLGPRQAGKTTLIREVLARTEEKNLFLNADEPNVRDLLTNATSTKLRSIIGDHRLFCVDEAQRIPNIGLTLKLITDQMPKSR